MTLLSGAVQLGLLYAMMAMGVYISFRILNIPDLTVDGSFTLGMAVSVMVTCGRRPFLALSAALLSGAAAGLCTGLLQTRAAHSSHTLGYSDHDGAVFHQSVRHGREINVSSPARPLFSLFQGASGLPASSAKLILLALCAAVLTAALAVLFKTRTRAGNTRYGR
jgi:putative ABC transport system permease protein